MDWIAKQPYVKVLREVDGLEQKKVQEQRFLYLYPDRIVTKYHSFSIEKVLDISYKKIAGKGGILYLHTLSGVYPYLVTDDPQAFIDAFKGIEDTYKGN